MTSKILLVYRTMVIPCVLLISCFAAWGVAANMTDPLVKVFGKIFTMSTLLSALVQFCYYGAYFCLALPAAFINRRYHYKTGVLTGLGLAAGAERSVMALEELRAIQSTELNAVMTPYVSIAIVLVLIWIGIALTRMSTASEAAEAGHVEVHLGATLGRLMKNLH